jgi:hypothetical protein
MTHPAIFGYSETAMFLRGKPSVTAISRLG